MSSVNLLRGLGPNEKCIAVYVGDGLWECARCGYTTEDDLDAKNHGMTGMDRMMDELGVPG